MRPSTGLLAVVAAGLALASSAAAHGPVGGGVGYVSTVSGLQPQVLGAIVSVLGGDDRLQLVNYSGKTIEVKGYDGEAFLRFTPNDGVYENMRSPAAYLSLVRDPSTAVVPSDADAKAKPVWRKATEGSTFVWHDHRIHWTGKSLPPVIQRAPREIHRIFSWKVPATVAGKPFQITGFLGYRPPPDVANGGGGTNRLLIAAIFGAVLLAAIAIGAGARRTRRRAPNPTS